MAKKSSTKSTRVRYRSAKSGRFITKKHAAKHPSTTIKEQVETDSTGPKKS
jgi:hypothetical protein